MTFYIKQGDTGPAILRQFLVDGVAQSLVGATVKFSMGNSRKGIRINKAAATVFAGSLPDGTVVTAADGWMRYAWQAADTATAGTFDAEFEVTFADATIETAPNSGYEQVTITSQIA